MASDVKSGQIPITSLVHGSQAPTPPAFKPAGGNSLPPGGNAPAHESRKRSAAAEAGVKSPPPPPPPAVDPQALVAALNHFLNDSGRPDQFRVAPQSGNKLIQQINPANGEVVGVFSVDEFPALARSIGATGLLIDRRA